MAAILEPKVHQLGRVLATAVRFLPCHDSSTYDFILRSNLSFFFDKTILFRDCL